MQAVKLASVCSWKDLSNNGLAATRELYVQLRPSESSIDVNKLAIAVFREHMLVSHSEPASGVRTHALLR